MTELEMMEAEKYWCENCCNWDKEHVQMDGYAKCKLTGTLCFCQESGKECKSFNVPAENVIAPPCKVGDTAHFLIEDEVACKKYISTEPIVDVCTKGFYTSGHDDSDENGDLWLWSDVGRIVYFSKEEAEAKLKEGEQ